MSPNIRACNNHTFTGYYSHSKTTSSITIFTPDWCPNHFACIGVPSSYTILTSLSQTTTTKNTSLVAPLNIRSRKHTHSYDSLSVSQGSVSPVSDAYTCPSGHSGCAMGYGIKSYYSDFTLSVYTRTISLTPAIPVNIKQKIHQHSLPDTLLNWGSVLGGHLTNFTSCPDGHTNCIGSGYVTGNSVWVGTTSSTTSLN